MGFDERGVRLGRRREEAITLGALRFEVEAGGAQFLKILPHGHATDTEFFRELASGDPTRRMREQGADDGVFGGRHEAAAWC